MRKLLVIATFALFPFLTLSGRAYAASNVTIRLEQPKTPTNQNTFPITFTALDIQNRAIIVKCFKQSPSDGAPVQFGSDITLTNGGNTGNCQVTSSQINGNGTYIFSVTATTGSDSASDTTTVVYNTDGPGDPKDYNKTKVGNCTYNIHFKTAADGGKTVKTEIYRSENTSFSADSGTHVGTVNGGSDEAHDFPNDVPNCDKTYYYAVRSFDSAGNGSGVVGDSVTVTHLTTISPTPGANGAIPVANGAGQVLGETAGKGETLGEASPSSTPSDSTSEEQAAQGQQGELQGLFGGGLKNWGLIASFVIIASAILYARRKK